MYLLFFDKNKNRKNQSKKIEIKINIQKPMCLNLKTKVEQTDNKQSPVTIWNERKQEDNELERTCYPHISEM